MRSQAFRVFVENWAVKDGKAVECFPIAYIHPCLLLIRGADEQLNRMASVSRSATTFPPKQGQYLARIMHHAACFYTSIEQMRASDPSGWIGVGPLAVQRVWY
jgi:hypothetical protein